LLPSPPGFLFVRQPLAVIPRAVVWRRGNGPVSFRPRVAIVNGRPLEFVTSPLLSFPFSALGVPDPSAPVSPLLIFFFFFFSTSCLHPLRFSCCFALTHMIVPPAVPGSQPPPAHRQRGPPFFCNRHSGLLSGT